MTLLIFSYTAADSRSSVLLVVVNVIVVLTVGSVFPAEQSVQKKGEKAVGNRQESQYQGAMVKGRDVVTNAVVQRLIVRSFSPNMFHWNTHAVYSFFCPLARG